MLDPAAVRAAEAALDNEGIAVMVEAMVKERIAAMLASGQLSVGVPGGSPAAPGVFVPPEAPSGKKPFAAPAAPPATPTPRRERPVSIPGLRPAPRRVPTSPGLRAIPNKPQSSPDLRAVPSKTSAPGLRAVPSVPPRPSPPAEPQLRTIERPGRRDPSPPPPPPSRTPRPAPPPKVKTSRGEPPVRLSSPRIPVPKRPAPEVGGAMWERVPNLIGGQNALLSSPNLDPKAITVLVMVNGTTTLRGLRTLVPQFDDAEFLSIVRDAVKQGVLELG
ncbi:MAG: hypothetical protein KDA24_21925 [Deltaproteobacteria bacterium]|nr:hypothetical protein [Deltaproteobacteria bacterium]